ncbi:YcgN family cysteine cluster protein [Gilvimarinus xylanilyticus]|uniref:UPF0260 protein M6D89_06960 n=1 Tax=Gilvimarinus xylanilyticus TaxID=2944139 RepID=A0A9X2KSP5_9GAMM|nr:YcgN family cysteine cluster protein [Gilvimarinus xylanilyticus]MCP8899036.1 YcgN family cysteine cluster protein [Gilvimarinus xylanilyticus]
MAEQVFWQRKRLHEMSRAEWESLCDGCGKCCLHKLEDEDTGEVYYTNVACKLLDTATCRCTDYSHRQQKVPDCLVLTPADVAEFHWLPNTCAYRLLAEGRPLPGWHPLLTGDPESVHHVDISVAHKVYREDDVDPDDLQEHIIYWMDE